jgi:hypothetical protein
MKPSHDPAWAHAPDQEPPSADGVSSLERCGLSPRRKRRKPMLGTILIILLVLLLLGALPTWGHSRSWGYGPSGLLGVVLIILVILLLMGRI